MEKKERKTIKRIVDLCIYCMGVIFVFFAVVLLLQEFIYVPEDVYSEPPPPAPSLNQTVDNKNNDGNMYSPAPYASPSPYGGNEILLPDDSPQQTPKETEQSTTNTDVSNKPRETPKPTVGFLYDKLYPIKLYFVDQRVSCEVLPVGIDKYNRVETVRSAHKAGWLYVSPYVAPGEIGKSVIVGHNRWGGKNGTFSVIKKMNAGESVAVEMSDGYARYYVVESIYECPHDDNTIMHVDETQREELVLITCKGDWNSDIHTSNTRVIAICVPKE